MVATSTLKAYNTQKEKNTTKISREMSGKTLTPAIDSK
jgi:hypothetical protein